MSPVRAPDRSDPRCMTRNCQPVVHRGPDSATGYGRLARTMVPSDQQQDTIPPGNCLIKRAVDRCPGAVQRVAVEIESSVRLDCSGSQPPLPVSVQRAMDGGARSRRRWRGACRRNSGLHPRWSGFDFHRGRTGRKRGLDRLRFARQGPNGRGHPRPEFLFLSGELAHGPSRPAPPFPWAEGAAPVPWPPCRPRSGWRAGPRPRRCRSGSAP